MGISTTFIASCVCALTAATIGHAYYHKQQFYPTVVYLTRHNASLAVLYAQALVFAVMFWQIMKTIFFGQLRAAESEHLVERGWYAVTETCLAFTVFRDDFSAKFVAQFTLLLFMKGFHWLCEDRVDYMERSHMITTLFHIRMMTLNGFLTMVDSYFVSHAYFTTLLKGASSQIVFGFEYAILMTIVFHASVKYLLHTTDLRNAHPWEQKAVYLLYTELVIYALRVFLYFIFVAVMINMHTFPLYSIRPFYLNIKALKKAFSDVILSRRAIHAMNHQFANVTTEDLESSDNTCIICREEMRVTGDYLGAAKKLPCTHMFHSACLRSWFQRQQTCPTCRRDILRVAPGDTQPQANQQAPVQAPNVNLPTPPANQQQPNGNVAQNANTPFFFTPPQFRMPQQQPTTANQPSTSGQPSNQNVAPNFSNVNSGNNNMPPMPPFMIPPIMSMMPPMPPAPIDPALSDEEVRAMEGNERRAVEARIHFLRNIQTLLDCASVQLQQYTSVLTSLAATPEFQYQHPVIAPTPLATSTPISKEPGKQPSTSQADITESAIPKMKEGVVPPSSSSSNLLGDEVRQKRLAYLNNKASTDNAISDNSDKEPLVANDK